MRRLRRLAQCVFLPSILLLIFSLTHVRGSESLKVDRYRRTPNSTASPAEMATAYSNASKLLADLLSDYDIRLRPGFGGDALLLTMDIIIASFDAISEVDMDYTLTMYLHQYWTDERLSWSNSIPIDEMTLSGEFSQHIWVPDTFLANDKHSFLHEVTERNKMLRVSGDGKVAYGMRLTSTLSCSMNLRNFPLDSQNCTVEIESYGYTTSEVLMKWNQPLAVHGVEQTDVPQFTITGYKTEDRIVSTATGSYQRLSLVFQLKRSVGYFIFQTYLPCVLIVMLSWVSFWINHEATSARVALGITTVLTMTTISTGVRQSLPRISYVKSIDIYLVMCFVFVFAALLEYAAVNYSYWGRKCRRQGDEGWPVNGQNKEDREGAVDMKEWGVPTNIINEIQKSETLDPRTQDLESSTPTHQRRTSSPILSLRKTKIEFQAPDSPEYPRYTQPSQGGRPRPMAGNKARRRFTTIGVVRRTARVKASIHHLGRRARKVIPTIRVRDVNVIDKYSRVIFPACFVIFNLFYWGYYLMLADQTSRVSVA